MRQRLVIAGLIIVALLVLGAFMTRAGISNVVGSGRAHTEKTAVSTLRTLHWAQGNFRRGGFLDVDGNGVGEFGRMDQLAGLAPLPDGSRVPAALVPTAGTRIEEDLLEAHGYCFRFDLPDDVHGRERRFVAYAWPRLLAAGSKAYCLNQDEDILETDGGWIGCENGPPPGTCPSAASTDQPGSNWSRWRGKTSQLKVGAVD